MLWKWRIFAIFCAKRSSARSDAIFQSFQGEIFNSSPTCFCLFIRWRTPDTGLRPVTFIIMLSWSALCLRKIHCRQCRDVTPHVCLVIVRRLWPLCRSVSVVMSRRIGGGSKNGALDFVLYYICVIFVSLYAITTATNVWLLY